MAFTQVCTIHNLIEQHKEKVDKGESMDRLEKQMAFILEIDKEKSINRQTYIADASRKENDAEHAWHMAVMALLLKEHAKEEGDLLKIISMLLIHDLVEIDAGDTYAYDQEAKKSQKEREEKAAGRLFGMLPKDQGEELLKLFEEFELGQTPEAKFAKALDRFQPLMLNDAAGGKSWKEHDVKRSQIEERNKETAVNAKPLWEYGVRNFINPNVKNGNIIDE